MPRPADGDRGPDRRETLRVRVEQPARPVGRGRAPGDEMRDGGGSVRRCGSSCGRRAAACRPRSTRAGMDDDAEPPLAIRGVDGARNLEHRHADLREPELVLLDQVEGEHVRRPGGIGARSASVTSMRSPGRDRMREWRARTVPDDRVARARRASGRRRERRRRRGSARSPSRRCRARRGRVTSRPARTTPTRVRVQATPRGRRTRIRSRRVRVQLHRAKA